MDVGWGPFKELKSRWSLSSSWHTLENNAQTGLVYTGKAGLNGRHEFAAVFIKDPFY